MNLQDYEDDNFNNDKQLQDTQIFQIENQDSIQSTQQYLDDKEQKVNHTNQHEQDQIMQLQDQLNANLKELEIKDEALIQPEIYETLDEIQKFEKKGQQKKAKWKNEYLQKLQDTEKILQQLQDLKKRTAKTQNKTEEEQLNKQLKLLLEDLQIQNVEQIPQEIEEGKQEIQKFLQKDQKKNASDSKIRLDKLVNAQEKYQELLKLKGETLLDQAIAKRKQLEDKLNELLQEIELQDANQIESEIKEIQDDIQKFHNKGQKNKVAEKKQTLEKLQNAQNIVKELQDLRKQIENIQIVKSQSQALKIQEVEKIPQEIEEAKKEIKKFLQKNQQKKASDSQLRLDKLNDAQIKYKELLKLKGATQLDQNLVKKQQLEDQLNKILQELDLQDTYQILSGIQETKDEIEKLEIKGNKNKVTEKKQTLEKLQNADKIQKELQDLIKITQNKQNLIQEQQLQNKLNSRLNYDGLSSNLINQKESENSSNLLQNQPMEIMKRFNLDDIKKEISQIPESSEKYVLQMLEICLNLSQQVNTAQTDQGGQQLLNQIEKIQKRLQIEDQFTPEINLSIQNIKMNIDQDNFEALAYEIDKLMKKIRPLNINEMKRLIQQADMAAQLIEGQDIILLLGGTGAGKSTTIHFLAGSQMGFKEIQLEQGSFLQYIAPVQVKNKTLQKIKVGFSATSETRFITPVSVNYKDLNMPQNGSIILCDSPGFDDTAGPEVDIANGLGIVKAIQKCKSVRPVILLSFKSMGDRGQGIKQIAHILVGFVQDIEDKLSSFSYLFSKFPEKYNINSELINIKNSLDQNTEEISDRAFVSLFEDMIDKTKKQCNKIDPIKGNPCEILKVLIKEQGIQDPSKVFKFSITANSYAAITDFVSKSQQTIISALKRSEFKLIEYRLDEIKFLFDILNQDSTQQVYEYCVNYIKEVIKKEYENATVQLTQQIYNNNKLDPNYLKQYQELIQKFSSIQDFRKKHLGNNVVSASDLIDELKSAVNKLTQVFDQENIIQNSAITNLDNIKLISEYLAEVNLQYLEACSKVQKQIEKICNSCKNALDIKNFDDLAEAIYQVKQYRKQYQNHLDDQPILDELEKIKDRFKNIIDQTVQDVNEKLKQQLLNDEAVNIINEQISIIEKAEKNQLLSQHINIDYVKNQRNNLYKKLIEHFENISKKIEEILKKEPDQAFLQLEDLINKMNQLRKIKGLESKTADIYYKCTSEIQGLMQQIKKDIEQLLNDFQHDKKKVDFQKIYRSLNQLKCAQWMNDVNKGAYEQIEKHISQELYKYCQIEIVQKLGDIDLSSKNFGNIQIASELVKELEAMILFEEYNTKLTELRQSSIQIFKQSVQYVFNQIREFINPNQSQPFQVKLDFQNLTKENTNIQMLDKQQEQQVQPSLSQDQDLQKNQEINKNEAINLERKKSNVQEELGKQKQTEQTFLFKLDGSKVEDYLNYINVCCSTKHIRDEANTLFEQLKQFLVFYRDSKNEQINTNYELILDHKVDDERKKTNCALQLASLMQELIDIQKYQETSKLIKATQLIQELKNKMSQFYVELSHDMNQPSNDKNQQSKNINISKLLSHIDNVFSENKFFNLYKSQQSALNNEFKEQYKNILQAIEKNEFKTVQIDLMAIDDNPVNQKAMNQIKAQLQYQIENLLEQANLEALQLGNQIEKEIIVKIIKKIDLIKKSKQSLKDYFEPNFLENVDKEIEKIIKEIGQKIQKYLESIKALLKQADFFEVEEKREHITQIQQLLVGYCKDQQNNISLEELQKNLEAKVSEITKIKYDDDKDFIFHPPKQILEKLSKVKGRNLKYAECFTSLQQILIDKVRKQIVDYSDSDQNQQNQKIFKVEALMNTVPDELKQILKDQFDNSKQQNDQKKKFFQESFNFAKESDDLEKKKAYLDICQKEKMFIFESEMKRSIKEDCQILFNKFQEEMEQSKPKQGIQSAIKLLEYNKHFENDDKIKTHYKNAQGVIKEDMKNKVNNLKCIQKCNNTDQYEKELDLFLNLLLVIKDYKDQFLSSDFEKNLEELCNILQDFFVGIFQSFEENLENNQLQLLEKDLYDIKKWENFILKLKKDFSKANNLSFCFQQIPQALNTIQDKSLSLKECMDRVVNLLSKFKTDILNFDFIQDIDKSKYYEMIQKGLKVLNQANEVKIDFKDTHFEPQCYQKECIPTIKKKIEEEEKKVEEVLKKDDTLIQNKDYNQINNYYENIQCFRINVNVEIPQIKIEQHIEKINEIIEQKIDKIENSIDLEKVDTVVQNIIKMKKHSDNLHPFKDKISNKLDNFLKYKYFKDKKTKAIKYAQLVAHLQEDQNGYGAAIIEESEVFKGISISIFNEITQRHDIRYILEKIRGDELEKTRLEQLFYKFEREYQEIVKKNLIFIERNTKSDKEIIEDLVTKIKTIAQTKAVLKDGKINWDTKVRQNLPSQLAHAFALWTLLNTQYFKETSDLESKQNYLFKPHAGQVISIFRLLGLGYEKESLYNNLVQIGTGEGKSIILAITSIIFALYDIDIYCACYSEYLSQRDYNSFLQLFNTIGVTSNIKYGIFNKICEQIINQHGEIRDLAVDYITNGFTERSKDKSKDKETKPKILLIDEVDVFFSQDFYGKLYNPIACLKDQCISDLAEFIWKKRNNYLSLKSVKETSIYKQCITKFKNLSCIIDEAIKDMISDSKNFQHQYVVQNRQIGYQKQDSISFDIRYGYKTLFAYFYEKEQNKVSEEKLRENTFISIKCGSFSYSEIPFEFNCIVGVTGTLETLSAPELNIVKDIYKITKSTYIPSVFGKNKRKFAEQKDIHIENEDDYFKVLREEINNNLHLVSDNSKQLRSVLVFFDSTQNLNKFYDFLSLSDQQMDVQVITEELSSYWDKKQQLIKKATISGQVTLLTASFGRGTDFICRDQRVLNNGGVHVIQTFYSNKKSEEVQIMGRSARQGQVGSYSLVLLDQKLQKIIGPDYLEILKQMRKKDNFYEKLSEYRKLREDQEYQNRRRFINQIKKDHDEGQKFVQAMLNQEEAFVREFLANKNEMK